MNIRRTLLAAVVATSVIFSFASTASAEEPTVTGIYGSCNIDGNRYSTVYYSDGSYCVINLHIKCGPDVGFRIIFSEKNQVSAAGRAYLDRLEKSGLTEVKRIPVRVKGAPPKISGKPEIIHLRRADVGPVLERFLTSVDPTRKGITSTPKDDKDK